MEARLSPFQIWLQLGSYSSPEEQPKAKSKAVALASRFRKSYYQLSP